MDNSTLTSTDERTEVTDIFIFCIVFHTFVFVLGVPGNCLILRVYWSKPHKTTTSFVITALAWADLSACLFSVFNVCKSALHLADVQFPPSLNVIFNFAHFSIPLSAHITSLIALDRYDCICRPQRRFFTRRRQKIAVTVAVLMALAINCPFLVATSMSSQLSFNLMIMEYILYTTEFVTVLTLMAVSYGFVYAAVRKHVRVGVEKTEHSSNHTGLQNTPPTNEVEIWVEQANSPPMSTLQLLKPCSQTFSAFKESTPLSTDKLSFPRSDKERLGHFPAKNLSAEKTMHCKVVAKTTVNREDAVVAAAKKAGNVKKPNLQRRTTRMLFIAGMVFLLTWLPYWISSAIKLAAYDEIKIDFKLNAILLTSAYAIRINHIVNPFIYGIFNRRFRQDCKQVFKKIKFCS